MWLCARLEEDVRTMHVTLTKFKVDVLKLVSFDQLRYVTFTLCYAMFCSSYVSCSVHGHCIQYLLS
jgi:hypothetical protein